MLNIRWNARIVVLTFSNILAWFSFFSILFLTNPRSAGTFGAIVLILSLATGFGSLITLIWQIYDLKKK